MHARELIEDLIYNRVVIDDGINPIATTAAISVIKNAEKFVFDEEMTKQVAYDANLLKTAYDFLINGVFVMPAPLCYFEYSDSKNNTVAFIADQLSYREVGLDFFARNHSSEVWRWSVHGARIAANEVSGKVCLLSSLKNDDSAFAKCVKKSCTLAVNMMVAVMAKGIMIEKIERSEKLQKAREKRGKPLLFEYKRVTIHLNKQNYSAGDKYGHHASPRLHFRRGHIRKLLSGKLVPVQACVVGSKDAGVIDKHYEVKS